MDWSLIDYSINQSIVIDSKLKSVITMLDYQLWRSALVKSHGVKTPWTNPKVRTYPLVHVSPLSPRLSKLSKLKIKISFLQKENL